MLKGALLFTLWYDMPHRATRDADLLGFGEGDLESVAQSFHDIAAVTADNGIIFDSASVAVDEIRKEAGYGGVRVVVVGELAKARCKTQLDIGFGDAVTPGPVDATYSVLLDDLPAPRLRVYPVYTVIAEKLHAIALLDMGNSRMKDYFDLSVLLERETLDTDLLAQAIKATFERRGMAVPTALPVGLTDEFAHEASRQALWQVFLKKNELIVRSRGSAPSSFGAGFEVFCWMMVASQFYSMRSQRLPADLKSPAKNRLPLLNHRQQNEDKRTSHKSQMGH